MPGHGRGIEHITFFGNGFPGVLKLSFDVTHLYDPPLRRSGVHVAKHRVRIESARRRTPSTSTACCCSAAAPASSSSSTTACIERVVGIGKPVKRIGKQMVFIHLCACLFTFGRSLEQIPVNLVWRGV